jgi:hypothetical protein
VFVTRTVHACVCVLCAYELASHYYAHWGWINNCALNLGSYLVCTHPLIAPDCVRVAATRLQTVNYYRYLLGDAADVHTCSTITSEYNYLVIIHTCTIMAAPTVSCAEVLRNALRAHCDHGCEHNAAMIDAYVDFEG